MICYSCMPSGAMTSLLSKHNTYWVNTMYLQMPCLETMEYYFYFTPTGAPQNSSPAWTTQSLNNRKTRLDIPVLDRAVDSFLESGLAASTTRTYGAGIKRYSSLCEKLHTQLMPMTEPLLYWIVTHLANMIISHNTIKVYLAGIRQLHIRRVSECPPQTTCHDWIKS